MSISSLLNDRPPLTHNFKSEIKKTKPKNSIPPSYKADPINSKSLKNHKTSTKKPSLNLRYLSFTPKKLITLYKNKSPASKQEETQQIEINLSEDVYLLSTDNLTSNYINNDNNMMISQNEEQDS